MARRAKPWRRKSRGWYVTIDGKQYSLGKDKNRAYQQYHELMRQPRQIQVSAESIVSMLDEFLEWTKQNRAQRTYEWYQERLQSFAQSVPDGISIAELKPRHVSSWLSSGTTWSNGYKRGLLTAVKRAFHWAQAEGLISQNPIRNMEKPPAGQREKVISKTEYEAILELARDQEFKDLITVSWETGCRPQESLRLEARHLDLGHKRWVFPVAESKGKKRPRIVYMSDAIVGVVRNRAEKHPAGPIFRNSKGKPWTRSSVSCRFLRMKKTLGTKYCLYDFRHSFATRKLESGLDALTVALLLGHSNPAMLSTTYQHLSHNPEFLRKQLERGKGGGEGK